MNAMMMLRSLGLDGGGKVSDDDLERLTVDELRMVLAVERHGLELTGQASYAGGAVGAVGAVAGLARLFSR